MPYISVLLNRHPILGADFPDEDNGKAIELDVAGVIIARHVIGTDPVPVTPPTALTRQERDWLILAGARLDHDAVVEATDGAGRYEYAGDPMLAAALDAIELEGVADDLGGDVDAIGHVSRHGRTILRTTDTGHRLIETYPTEADALAIVREAELAALSSDELAELIADEAADQSDHRVK